MSTTTTPATMPLSQLHEVLLRHVGERARITIVNGVGRECVTAPGVIGMWHEYPTIGAYRSGDRYLGGNIVGGEYDNASRIEIMAANGRYVTLDTDNA